MFDMMDGGFRMKYCIRYNEYNRSGRLVVKEKCFKAEKSLFNFIDRMQYNPNFNEILLHWDEEY